MKIKTKPLGALVAVLALLAIAGCGGDDSNPPKQTGAGNRNDAAFVADMVSHHESAIAMAKIARTRAEHAEIKALAKDIIEAQKAEVAVLDRIGEELHQMGVSGGHMGMSDEDMGMGGDMSMLDTAKPFDRAFIDMMIPHHDGAIRMANRQLADGKQPTLRKMAKDIIAAQSREIAQMREWRRQWYGTGKSSESGSGMDHDDSMGDGH